MPSSKPTENEQVTYPCPPGCDLQRLGVEHSHTAPPAGDPKLVALQQMGVEHSHTAPPAGDPKLVAKLAEVFSAEHHLSAAVFSLREWFSKRKPGEDFGLRLLDCQLWAANLCWLLVQAQIDVKGEEE